MTKNITHTSHSLENPPLRRNNYAASQNGDLQRGETTLCKEGNRIRLHGGMVVMLKRLQMEKILGLSRAGIYRMMDKNSSGYCEKFPLPIRYGGGRSVYWIAEEVADWVEEQIRLSRNVNKPGKKV